MIWFVPVISRIVIEMIYVNMDDDKVKDVQMYDTGISGWWYA